MITEAALLQEALSGSQDAFEQLHALLEPPLRRYVRRLVGSEQETEDVLQESFLALFRSMERVQPAAQVRPYLFRIARNRCYDLMSRRKRDTGLELNDEADYVRFDLTRDPPPEEATHWLLLKVEVDAAIDRLPDAQRETLLLFCENRMTYAEIAAVTEVSIGTVKSRLFHAKRTLRGMVSPEIIIAIQESSGG